MRAVVVGVLFGVMWLTAGGPVGARPQTGTAPEPSAGPSIQTAQHLFYVGAYEDAAATALRLREADPSDLATYELRTSALHFLIKRHLGDAKDKAAALKACVPCPDLLATLKEDVTRGQQLARARLKLEPKDAKALFFLGKIDLNHVWLHLGTLGQRTGWNEYWEARHSLDNALEIEPTYIRARVARAWIDYIVDTRVPRGLRWVLGGGNKKGALQTIRNAAVADTDFYSRTEAAFGLWEMLGRESQEAEAVAVAERLAVDFPENRELARFLKAHQR
jgi:hypothetical protein